MGVGFALRGLSVITRCPANRAEDGLIRAVRYDDADPLCLDGVRLVHVGGGFGFDGSGTREYRTVPDAFVKVVAHFGPGYHLDRGPDWFEVFTKSGRIIEYGSTDTARAMATSQVVAAWWVSKERDRRDNQIVYTYTNRHDRVDGHTIEIIPERIEYAHRADGTPTRAVVFQPTDATPPVTYFSGGMKLQRTKLLSRVEMRAGDSLGLVRSYLLAYVPGEGTRRPLLRRVDECAGAAEVCKPATTFTWNDHASTGLSPTGILAHAGWDVSPSAPLLVADVNGDGLPDIVGSWYDGSTDKKVESVSLNKGTSWGPWERWIEYPAGDDHLPVNGTPFDYDQDGRTDVLFDYLKCSAPDENGQQHCTNDMMVFRANPDAEPHARFDVIDTGIPVFRRYRLGDIDGDGVADLLQCNDTNWTVRLWTPNAPTGPGFSQTPVAIPALAATPCSAINDRQLMVVDFDGDGKAEIVVPPVEFYTNDDVVLSPNGDVSCGGHPCRSVAISFMNGAWATADTNLMVHTLSSADSTVSSPDSVVGAWPFTEWNDGNGELIGHTIFVDVNGDGLPDAVRTGYGDGRPRTFMNTGKGFTDTGVPSLSGSTLPDAKREDRWARFATLIDYNGDGRTDLLVPMLYHCGVPDDPRACWVVWQSVGDGTFALKNTGLYFPEDSDSGANLPLQNTWVLDSNGDGRHDLLAVLSPDGSDTFNYHTFQNDGPQDLLLSITDGTSPLDPGDPGFIPTVRIFYESLVDRAVTDGIPTTSSEHDSLTYVAHDDPNNDCAYPRACVVGPEMVVGKYSVANGRNEQRSFRVRYRDGRFHRLGRGFLGFGERVIVDLNAASGTVEQYDNITYDPAWRAFPYAGQVVRSWAWTSEQPSLLDPGRVELTFTERTFLTQSTNGAANTYFTMPERVDTTRQEGTMQPGPGNTVVRFVKAAAATPLQILGKSYDWVVVHDDYGNAILELHDVDGADLSTSVVRSYDNDPASWLIGRLRHERTCSSAMSTTKCRVTELDWNSHGEVSAMRIGDPADPATQVSVDFAYDKYGHVGRTTADDKLGHYRVSCVSYDDNGIFPYATRNGLGHTAYSKQDPGLGVMTAAVDENGLVTRWRHDAFGRVTEEQRPDGSSTTVKLGRTKDGGPQGNWWNVKVTTREKNGAIRTTEFDSLGRPVRSLTVAGEVEACGAAKCSPVLQLEEETSYDFLGRVERVSLPWMSGDTLTGQLYHLYSYDASGRLTQHSEPWGRVTTFAHAGHVDYATDWLGTSSIERDALDRPVKVTDKLGDFTETLYGPFGDVWGTVRFGSEISLSERDAYGRVIHEEDPDRGQTDITYDGFGDVLTIDDAKGRHYELEYDVLGRLRKRTDTDGVTTWAYDSYDPYARGIGKRASVTTVPVSGEASVKSYAYNERSQLSGVSLTVGGETLHAGFGYDPVGRLHLIAYPQLPGVTPLVVLRDYDAYGNLVTIRDNTGGTPYWQLQQVDGAGRPMVETFRNQVTGRREYNPSTGLIEQITATRKPLTPFTKGQRIQSLTYAYDQGLRMKSRADNLQVSANGVRTELFRHDALSRLTCSSFADIPTGQDIQGRLSCALSIRYRPNGNIDYKSDVGTYTYDYNHPHAVRMAGASVFEYDEVGNQTKRPDVPNIEYTTFDLPKRMDLDSGSVEYGYDGDQNRILKQAGHEQANETTLYFEDLYERVTADGAAPVHRYYVAAGSATAVITRQAGVLVDNLAYLHTDALGSTDVVTNGSGAVDQQRSYDAFGARRNPKWGEPPTGSYTSNASPVGFTGHEDEQDLGLVNMRGRIYDPKIGRFLQTDPLVSDRHFGQSWNPYSYVLNSPLTFVDPSGFAPMWIFVPEITIVGDRPTIEQQLGGAIDLAASGKMRRVAPPNAEASPDWNPTWMKDSARDDQVQAGPGGVPQAVREGSPFAPGSMGSVDGNGSSTEDAPGPVERTGRSWGGFLGGLGCGFTPGCGAVHQIGVETKILNAPVGGGIGSPGAAWSLGVALGGAFLTAGGVTGDFLGGAASSTGIGAAVGVPAIVVSTSAAVGGVANVGAGVRGLTHALMTNGSGNGGELKEVFNGVRNAPGYPQSFVARAGGTTRNTVKDTQLLAKLRELEPGEWHKVYKDGWVGSDKVSLHYFQSRTGKVFNFKIKPGWSNE